MHRIRERMEGWSALGYPDRIDRRLGFQHGDDCLSAQLSVQQQRMCRRLRYFATGISFCRRARSRPFASLLDVVCARTGIVAGCGPGG